MKVGGWAWRVFGGRWFGVFGEWWFPAVIVCLIRGHSETDRVYYNGEFCGRCGGEAE